MRLTNMEPPGDGIRLTVTVPDPSLMMWNCGSIMWNIWAQVNETGSTIGRRRRYGGERHPSRRPSCLADLHGGPGRRAPLVRRPAGGLRPAEVHDVADADRPRALRAARATRRRQLRRRQPLLAVRRQARPR